eukprot:scaffold229395_cov22-Tisochrysis_lutea.AAC.1
MCTHCLSSVWVDDVATAACALEQQQQCQQARGGVCSCLAKGAEELLQKLCASQSAGGRGADTGGREEVHGGEDTKQMWQSLAKMKLRARFEEALRAGRGEGQRAGGLGEGHLGGNGVK